VKIDLVSEHASPLAVLGGDDAGGQNVHVAALALALGELGADVTVHTRRDDPSLPATVAFGPGVAVSHIDAGPAEPVPKDKLFPYLPAFTDALAERWRSERPDVVHAHFWMSGVVSLGAARPLGIPVALTYHALGVVKQLHQGQQDTSPRARLARERELAQRADLILATTCDEALELVTQGADPSRITVVPCGVDLSAFRPCGSTAPRRTDRARVVIVSRLVERKGIGSAIEALADIPGAELVVAGGPPEAMLEEDPHARRFLDVAQRQGVADRVELLGALDRRHVPPLLRSADVVVCCPWYEPFGLVAVEAMACGVPVVASAVGGLAETVVHGVTGLHVPPRDPIALAAAVRTLLANGPMRQRMGAAAAHRAQGYGWPDIAARTLEALTTVARTPATVPAEELHR